MFSDEVIPNVEVGKREFFHIDSSTISSHKAIFQTNLEKMSLKRKCRNIRAFQEIE